MLSLLAMTDAETFAIWRAIAFWAIVALLIRGLFRRLRMINETGSEILDQLKDNSSGDFPPTRDQRMLVYCLKCEQPNEPTHDHCTACGHLLSTPQPVDQSKDRT